MEVEIISDDYRTLSLHLDKFPDDWDARLVLSDMLEEAGELELARFQRILAKYQKRPCPPGDQPWKLAHAHKDDLRKGWSWWGSGVEDVPSVIGTDARVCNILEVKYTHPTRVAAEAGLFRAFDSVNELEAHLRKVWEFQSQKGRG